MKYIHICNKVLTVDTLRTQGFPGGGCISVGGNQQTQKKTVACMVHCNGQHLDGWTRFSLYYSRYPMLFWSSHCQFITCPCDSVAAAFHVSVRNIQTGNKVQLLTVLVTNHQDYFATSHGVLESNLVIFITDWFQLNHPHHWTWCSERVRLMLCPRSEQMLMPLPFGFKDPWIKLGDLVYCQRN